MLVHLKEYTYTSNDIYGHKLMLPACVDCKTNTRQSTFFGSCGIAKCHTCAKMAFQWISINDTCQSMSCSVHKAQELPFTPSAHYK